MNNFLGLSFSSRRQVLTSPNKNNDMLMKVEVFKNPNRVLDIKGECEVLKYLNEKKCQTSPKVYDFGTITKSDLSKLTTESIGDCDAEEFNYIIEEFIPHKDEYTFSDILLTMIEQKRLGIYHGDIKPANIRFNPKNSTCYFIDYDQAIFLDETTKNTTNIEFFNFCDKYDNKKYGYGSWLRHFKDFNNDNIERAMNSGALNLEDVSLIKKQNTTNTVNGLYHTINHKDICLNGNRSVKARSLLLDNLEFKKGEKILDIGCNQGTLSFYLHDRGCAVTGFDIDKDIISAAKITANIFEKDVKFDHVDLDSVDTLDKFDTVMIFSVFHHTLKQVENGKKIANSCNRIILETRLRESGSQPMGPDGTWIKVSTWRFKSIDQLTDACEKLFPGFSLNKNLGVGSKGRYILEFVKT